MAKWQLFVHVAEQRSTGKLKRARCVAPPGTECCRLIHNLPKMLVRTFCRKIERTPSGCASHEFANGRELKQGSWGCTIAKFAPRIAWPGFDGRPLTRRGNHL